MTRQEFIEACERLKGELISGAEKRETLRLYALQRAESIQWQARAAETMDELRYLEHELGRVMPDYEAGLAELEQG